MAARIPIALLFVFVLAAFGRTGPREELFAQAEELAQAGGEWFNKAGDTELSTSERNKARKEAYERLKKAYDLLDGWVEEHPSEAEALEDRMVEIHMKIYWIKKESPIGLIDEPSATRERPSDWPPEPPPDLHEPALGPQERKPEPSSGDPDATPEAAPEKPRADPEEVFAKITAFERKNPYDVEACLELYQEFLERFEDDTRHELARRAMQRIGGLSERLKGAYRRLRDEDPDAMDFEIVRDEKRLVRALGRDLKSGDEEERRRAAIDMGTLGARMAPYYLTQAIERDDSPVVVRAAEESIVRIGGKKAVDELEDFARSRKTERALKGIELLAKIGAKDRVQARYVSRALGTYLKTRDEEVYNATVRALEGLKEIGWEGFAVALYQVRSDRGRQLDFIRRIGDCGDPRAARALAPLLLQKGDRGLMDEAIASLKKLGRGTVPYLIPFLKGRTRTGTGYALRQITGQTLGSKASAWQRWWHEQGGE